MRLFRTLLLALCFAASAACAQLGFPVTGATSGGTGTAFNPSSVTYAGATGTVPFVVARSAIPFIGPGSGSIGNNGALTAITTATNIAYPNCYMWFTANQIAAGVGAGWYYVQMSTTQAGTIFNNVYTSGTPTVPGSPTAFVTTGPGAFTGDTAEEFGPTITIPASSMSANGMLRASHLWSYPTGNAGSINPRVRFSGNAGTAVVANTVATSVRSSESLTTIRNSGSVAVQVGSNTNNIGLGTFINASPAYLAVNTAVSTTLVFSMQRATATDTVVLEGFTVEILP